MGEMCVQIFWLLALLDTRIVAGGTERTEELVGKSQLVKMPK